jgi:predicted aspartyl protease
VNLLGRRDVLTGLAAAPALASFLAPARARTQDEHSISILPASALRLGAEVYVNATGPWRFVVDTGANRTVLATELAERLALRPEGVLQVHGIAAPVTAGSVGVRELKLDRYRYGPFRAPILPRADLGADGLLGLDALQDRLVVLDLALGRIEIGGSHARTGTRMTRKVFEDRSVVARARQRFGQLTLVDAEVGGVAVAAFLDTGAQRSVGNMALRRAIRARMPETAARALKLDIGGATGQVVSGEVAMMPGLRIGGARVGAFGAVFADLHTFDLWRLQERPALLVGMDVLSLFRSVALDFGRSEVRFRFRADVDGSPGHRADLPPALA